MIFLRGTMEPPYALMEGWDTLYNLRVNINFSI